MCKLNVEKASFKVVLNSNAKKVYQCPIPLIHCITFLKMRALD